MAVKTEAVEQSRLMMPQRKLARLGECEERAMRRCGEMELETRQRKVVSPPLQKMCQVHAGYRSRQGSKLASSGLLAGVTAAELNCLDGFGLHRIGA